MKTLPALALAAATIGGIGAILYGLNAMKDLRGTHSMAFTERYPRRPEAGAPPPMFRVAGRTELVVADDVDGLSLTFSSNTFLGRAKCVVRVYRTGRLAGAGHGQTCRVKLEDGSEGNLVIERASVFMAANPFSYRRSSQVVGKVVGLPGQNPAWAPEYTLTLDPL